MAMALDSNIVGYNTVTLDKSWTLVGFNFEDCGGGSIPLQDAIPFTVGMTKGSGSTSADTIQIQTASGSYETYFLHNGEYGPPPPVGPFYDAARDGKWVSTANLNVPATVSVQTGTAFWYLAQTPDENFQVKVAGQVLLAGQTNITVNLAAKLIANPYPTDIPLNDGILYTAGMTKGSGSTSADNIQVQTASGSYETYFLHNGEYGPPPPVGPFYDAARDGKWVSTANLNVPAAQSVVIPAAKSVWYLRRGESDFDITITRPFSIN